MSGARQVNVKSQSELDIGEWKLFIITTICHLLLSLRRKRGPPESPEQCPVPGLWVQRWKLKFKKQNHNGLSYKYITYPMIQLQNVLHRVFDMIGTFTCINCFSEDSPVSAQSVPTQPQLLFYPHSFHQTHQRKTDKQD